MPAIIARAPTRLDFGGGWTDVPPYSDAEGGFVCNVAIARHATVRLTPAGGNAAPPSASHGDDALASAVLRSLGAPSMHVAQRNDFPFGAGLGGSSAAGVAMVAAVTALRSMGGTIAGSCADAIGGVDRSTLAEESRRLEVEELGIAGGRQDHYAAAYGGALALTFGDATRVERIPLDSETVRALETRLVVVYTGQSRISGDTITAVLDAYGRRERRVLDALACMKGLAREMAAALVSGDIDSLGRLVGAHWGHQRSLHPAIPTARIDAIIARGGEAGALGAKALGASGGGCVLLVAGEGMGGAVRDAVAPLGEPVEFRLDPDGVRCWATEGDAS